MAFLFKNQMIEQELTQNEILSKKAKLINDKPLFITVNIEPQNFKEKVKQFFFLMRKSKRFTVKGINLGTLINISDLLLKIDYEEKPPKDENQLAWAYDVIRKNGLISVQVICMAVHNLESDYPKEYERLFLNNLEAEDIANIAFNILDKMNVFAFTNTITSIRNFQILKSEVEPVQSVETIAPNKVISLEQLEQLPAIFSGANPI